MTYLIVFGGLTVIITSLILTGRYLRRRDQRMEYIDYKASKRKL